MAGLGKVAIVGAGSVGTAVAYASVIQGVADEVVLFDANAAKAIAEVLDLRHGLQFVPPARVDGGPDIDVCAGADVVVVTAGAKQHPGQSRMDLAALNAALVRDLVPGLVEAAPDTILLFVTNPVDVITFVAQQVAGIPYPRVIGSGTVLDTSRLRHLLAERLGVAVGSVHALWSTATVGGVPITDVVGPDGGTVDADELGALLDEVRGAAYRIIEGKGATNLAIGLSTARILAAIGADERAVLPISARHHVDGIGDVCMALPTVVGRAGALATLEVPLDEVEHAGLHASATAIRHAIDLVS
jgi:L-lactate dehydrogenase